MQMENADENEQEKRAYPQHLGLACRRRQQRRRSQLI
jgi:hypothetical protein